VTNWNRLRKDDETAPPAPIGEHIAFYPIQCERPKRMNGRSLHSAAISSSRPVQSPLHPVVGQSRTSTHVTITTPPTPHHLLAPSLPSDVISNISKLISKLKVRKRKRKRGVGSLYWKAKKRTEQQGLTPTSTLVLKWVHSKASSQLHGPSTRQIRHAFRDSPLSINAKLRERSRRSSRKGNLDLIVHIRPDRIADAWTSTARTLCELRRRTAQDHRIGRTLPTSCIS